MQDYTSSSYGQPLYPVGYGEDPVMINPCRPQPQGCAMLCQQIVSCNQERIRCAQFMLKLKKCRNAACVCDIRRNGNPVIWRIQPGCSHHLELAVQIPLDIETMDCDGCSCVDSTYIESQIRLPLTVSSRELWRYEIVVFARVRMLEVCVVQQGCVEASLEIMLEAYLLHIQPQSVSRPQRPQPCPPPCPQPCPPCPPCPPPRPQPCPPCPPPRPQPCPPPKCRPGRRSSQMGLPSAWADNSMQW